MSKEYFNIIFSTFLNKYQVKIEVICAIIYFVGFYLAMVKINGGMEMIGFSLTTLAIIYYLSAFVQKGGSNILIIVSKKVIGISSAVTLVGIMFYNLGGSGATVMLGVGTSSLAIAALLLAINELLSDEGIQSSAQLIRSSFILCLSIFLYLNPQIL